MEKYEYKVLDLLDKRDIEIILNEFAENGWSFKSIVEDNPYYIVILERKK